MSNLFSSIGLAEILALSSSLTYSFTFIFLRQGLRSGSPLAGVLTMGAIVGSVGLIAAASRGTLQTSTLTPILWFALAGCVGQGVGQMASFTGIQRMGVSRAAPIQGSAPIWAILLAVLILGEKPGLFVWVGAACVVTGVGLLSKPKEGEGGSIKDWFQGSLIFPLGASLMFAIMPVVAKFGFALQNTPFVAVGVAFSSAVVFLCVSRFGLGIGGEIRFDRRSLRWFILAGLSTTLSAGFFWTSLSMGDVSIMMPLSRLGPLWAVLWTYLFLGHIERVTPRIFFSAFLIVSGGGFIMAFK
ncbi:MAG: DMT family transporter [Nitrospinaceae bacterium]|nr:DMT family transporter [Nitrospinaceae bacterium]MBT4095238.1 DMT family transporter [Nitrospinaceae bacterium]MBT4430970.1 DMT family transporter [Nitrospinaceae bacterium]MBT5369414.1 DMT family transporter [Nitrospinaceae bacterium]MBT5948281.1 DMT family transporter [Nitrospinaceae bacterium]